MEQGRKESDIEGVAIHGGPESCVSYPQGGDEALTGGAQAGLLSREITSPRVPTSLVRAEGNIAGGVRRKSPADPARSENQGRCASSMRENRESPALPVAEIKPAGRSGKAKAISPR